MNRTTFVNAKVFDGVQSDYLEQSAVVVEGERIVAVDRKPGASGSGEVIDVAGKTLMPGLIDAHCHVLGSSLKVTDVETQPLTYVASYASKVVPSHRIEAPHRRLDSPDDGHAVRHDVWIAICGDVPSLYLSAPDRLRQRSYPRIRTDHPYSKRSQ